jgi:hypothetical protein
MTQHALNPYRYLLSSVRAMLKQEVRFGADDRKLVSWMILAEFAGTSMLVGKAGVNTCFWTFGSGDRQFGYPNELMGLLERLGRQEHVLYMLVDAAKTKTEKFLLSELLEAKPRRGDVVVSVSMDGVEAPLYCARRNIKNEFAWRKVAPDDGDSDEPDRRRRAGVRGARLRDVTTKMTGSPLSSVWDQQVCAEQLSK